MFFSTCKKSVRETILLPFFIFFTNGSCFSRIFFCRNFMHIFDFLPRLKKKTPMAKIFHAHNFFFHGSMDKDVFINETFCSNFIYLFHGLTFSTFSNLFFGGGLYPNCSQNFDNFTKIRPYNVRDFDPNFELTMFEILTKICGTWTKISVLTQAKMYLQYSEFLQIWTS